VRRFPRTQTAWAFLRLRRHRRPRRGAPRPPRYHRGTIGAQPRRESSLLWADALCKRQRNQAGGGVRSTRDRGRRVAPPTGRARAEAPAGAGRPARRRFGPSSDPPAGARAVPAVDSRRLPGTPRGAVARARGRQRSIIRCPSCRRRRSRRSATVATSASSISWSLIGTIAAAGSGPGFAPRSATSPLRKAATRSPRGGRGRNPADPRFYFVTDSLDLLRGFRPDLVRPLLASPDRDARKDAAVLLATFGDSSDVARLEAITTAILTRSSAGSAPSACSRCGAAAYSLYIVTLPDALRTTIQSPRWLSPAS
jgi:hypothetical protein